jgi:hypothetical protein
MAITLRDLPPEVEKILHERAKREGISLNRTAIRMLEEAAGLNQNTEKPARNHDFDKFAGTWTADEADEFDRRLAEMRQIDWEMWK